MFLNKKPPFISLHTHVLTYITLFFTMLLSTYNCFDIEVLIPKQFVSSLYFLFLLYKYTANLLYYLSTISPLLF
jgi:hypothetical protein